MIKTSLKITAGLLSTLVVTGLSLPYIVSVEHFKKPLVKMVREKTGIHLKIESVAEWHVFPTTSLRLKNVSINKSKKRTYPFELHIESITLKLNLQALLHQKLEITEVIIEKPTFLYRLDFPKASNPQSDQQEDTSEEKDVEESKSPITLAIEKIRLDEGTCKFEKEDQTYTLNKIYMDATSQQETGPYTCLIKASYNDQFEYEGDFFISHYAFLKSPSSQDKVPELNATHTFLEKGSKRLVLKTTASFEYPNTEAHIVFEATPDLKYTLGTKTFDLSKGVNGKIQLLMDWAQKKGVLSNFEAHHDTLDLESQATFSIDNLWPNGELTLSLKSDLFSFKANVNSDPNEENTSPSYEVNLAGMNLSHVASWFSFDLPFLKERLDLQAHYDFQDHTHTLKDLNIQSKDLQIISDLSLDLSPNQEKKVLKGRAHIQRSHTPALVPTLFKAPPSNKKEGIAKTKKTPEEKASKAPPPQEKTSPKKKGEGIFDMTSFLHQELPSLSQFDSMIPLYLDLSLDVDELKLPKDITLNSLKFHIVNNKNQISIHDFQVLLNQVPLKGSVTLEKIKKGLSIVTEIQGDFVPLSLIMPYIPPIKDLALNDIKGSFAPYIRIKTEGATLADLLLNLEGGLKIPLSIEENPYCLATNLKLQARFEEREKQTKRVQLFLDAQNDTTSLLKIRMNGLYQDKDKNENKSIGTDDNDNTNDSGPSFRTKITLESNDLAPLLSHIRKENWPLLGPLQGELILTPTLTNITLENAIFLLDPLKITLQGNIPFDASIASIKGKIDGKSLLLDLRSMEKSPLKKGENAQEKEEKDKKEKEEKLIPFKDKVRSKNPITTSFLKTVKGTFSINLNDLTIQSEKGDWLVDALHADIKSENNTLVVQLNQLLLLESTLKGNITLQEGEKGGLKGHIEFDAQKIDLSLLQLFSPEIPLKKGLLNTKIQYTVEGKSPFEILSSLEGDQSFEITQALVQTIDIRSLKSALKKPSFDLMSQLSSLGSQKAPLNVTSIQGSIKAASGILTLDPALSIISDECEAKIDGPINLPEWSMDLGVEATLSGISLPSLHIGLQGPLDQPGVNIDKEALIKSALGLGGNENNPVNKVMNSFFDRFLK